MFALSVHYAKINIGCEDKWLMRRREDLLGASTIPVEYSECLWLHLRHILGVAEIVTKPTVTEVVVGGSTFLNCSTNIVQEVHWFHTPLESNQDRNFLYGYDQFYQPYIGRFQMEKNDANGAYNLVIPSVKLEDAGVYECQDETGRGKKQSAQLIVLGSTTFKLCI